MTTINLKDYYPWYLTNEYIEVTDEVAEARKSWTFDLQTHPSKTDLTAVVLAMKAIRHV